MGSCGTIADALAQATAKYANLSENDINKQIIGPQQVRELRAFFGRSVTGVQASAANLRVSPSLATDTLLAYAVIAERTVARGADTLGVQAQRLALIKQALEQRGYLP